MKRTKGALENLEEEVKETTKSHENPTDDDEQVCLICMEEFDEGWPVFKTDCCMQRLHAFCWSELEFSSGATHTRANYNKCPVCRKPAILLTETEAEAPRKSRFSILQSSVMTGPQQEIRLRKHEKQLLLEEMRHMKATANRAEEEAAGLTLTTVSIRSELIGVKRKKSKGKRCLKIGAFQFDCVPEEEGKQPSGRFYKCTVPDCPAKIETEKTKERQGQTRRYYLTVPHQNHPK